MTRAMISSCGRSIEVAKSPLPRQGPTEDEVIGGGAEEVGDIDLLEFGGNVLADFETDDAGARADVNRFGEIEARRSHCR